MKKTVTGILRNLVQWGYCVYWRVRAVFRMGRRRHRNGRLRVGFLVQMAEVWDKQINVYEELLTRDNTEVFLFVVPPYDNEKKTVVNSFHNNYFLNNYPNAIKAVDANGKGIDLRQFELDYVFYQRPYDHYLPKGLRSNIVSAYARCCYIPYGFSGSDVFDDGNTNFHFFVNIYASFMESAYMQKKLKQKFPVSSVFGVRRIENVGYPSLEPFLKPVERKSVETVLWTPRWSYDPTMGGSHFLEYRDMLSKIKNQFHDINCIFRPHPMMFEELKAKGLMTAEEISDYLHALQDQGISYDTGCPINQAIERADVLISDYSSIIIAFFLTGKPIIYCPSQIELNETYSEMAKYMYIAENEEQIRGYMEQIALGNDYLYEKRKHFISSEFSNHRHAAGRIVDMLIKYQ